MSDIEVIIIPQRKKDEVTVSFKEKKEIVKLMDSLAKTMKKTRSDVIRMSIRLLLAKLGLISCDRELEDLGLC